MLYEKILKETQHLEEQINLMQEKINKLPNGKLICTRNGTYYKWYQSDGHQCTYIPKSNRQLAEQLAIKKYLCLLSKHLLQEKRALEQYLRHHSLDTSSIDKFLTEPTGYQELLIPYFQPHSGELLTWMNAPYEQNTLYSEQLIHKTKAGIFVRSKSEAMIVMMLHTHKIPFRYECALHLEQAVIFPDFTIRHPRTDQIYYWEHFGLMDDYTYSKNAYSKLQLYSSQGIIPSINLITTYETKEHPLDYEIVEKIISHYFL